MKAILSLLLILMCAASPALSQDTLWVSRGARRIFGLYHKPAGEGRHPLAIIAHGFNGTHDAGKAYFRALADMGYACYALDFPCGSIHSRSDNNTMNMSALDERADLMATVRYFRSRPDVDTSRIVLIGESQGGFVSALTAAQMKDTISRLVLVFPALCIPANWNRTYPTEADIPEVTRLWEVPMGRRFFLELRDMDVFSIIPAYRGPVQIVQGDADRVVSIEDSRRAASLYNGARLHIIAGAGHGFRPKEQEESLGVITAFLRGE